MQNAGVGSKSVKSSALVTSKLMMPEDANVAGNVFGGVILKSIDETAALAGFRHARKNIVTASIDRMDFHAPVYIGDILILKAAVNYTGKTSMEIGVRVEAENRLTGKLVHAGSAYMTYVAIGKDNKPTILPRIIPESNEEIKRYENAEGRRLQRLRDAGKRQ